MNIFLEIIIVIVSVIIGFILIAFTTLLLFKLYLRNSTKIKFPNGISSLEEITLGGEKQWIFIRGMDQNNPILIFLHGGPGEPTMGISSSRRLDAELIKHFTMVHWDQRGAGKSFNTSIPKDSMTLDRIVEDCNELIDYLRIRFNTDKVFIVAHSSGTLFGIKTAYKYPEKIHAYVGVAQIINDYEHERISHDFVVEKAERFGNKKHQIAIEAIGPPPYESPKQLFEKAKYIVQYGGMLVDYSFRKMIGIILPYLTSPEYSLTEGIRTILGKGRDFTINALWKEITVVNFTKEIESIKVPVYFFEGKYDMITPTIQVEKFYNNLKAERGKRLFIFEKSAHFPMIEEKEEYQDLLIKVVLKESYQMK
jgi:pimeloyl-ACP methyl ester carboxylesterase